MYSNRMKLGTTYLLYIQYLIYIYIYINIYIKYIQQKKILLLKF